MAAATLTVSAVLLCRIPLPRGEADLTPSHHWPEPLLAMPVAQDGEPVLITIEYQWRRKRATTSCPPSIVCRPWRRDGAYNWGVAEDAAEPGAMVEWFMAESCAEYLRQHRRVARTDADLQVELKHFHAGPSVPRARHFLASGKPVPAVPTF